MNLTLETATNSADLSEYESETEVAVLVIILLAEGNDWVRLRSSKNDRWYTEWTALERNSDNIPTQIGYRQFDGEMGILTNEVP